MILSIENPKDSTRKLLELINDYSKVAGYKINTQKSLAFLYTNNEKTEREIKETIPFFFLKIALAIWGFLYFHTNCEIICSSSMKNTISSLIEIALNL